MLVRYINLDYVNYLSYIKNRDMFRLVYDICRWCLFNPLNAELIPICHLLILLVDLTFMRKCIASISNKMQRYTIYLYLETALHVSGGTSTHHRERIQLYPQHLDRKSVV
jgi:hypothetical protein